MLAATASGFALAPAASGYQAYFCPGSGSQIYISADGSCTKASAEGNLVRVYAQTVDGNGVDHCAVGKQYDGGGGANVIPAQCGTASYQITGCYSARYGYPKIVNRTSSPHYFHGTTTTSRAPLRSTKMRLAIIERAALAAALAGAAFATATLVMASAQPAAPAAVPTAPAPLQVTTPDAKLLSAFAVFRDAFRADGAGTGTTLDGQPATVVEIGALPGGRAVRASADAGRACVSYIPRGAIGPGGACDAPDVAARIGVFTSTVYADDDIEVVGLVPDGVRSVAFATGSDSRVELPVTRNGYAGTLHAPPSGLDFDVGARHVHQGLGGSS